MNKPQDFTKKMTIVVSKELEPWQVLNTVGHISAYLGHAIGENFNTGDYFETKDGIKHARNSQYPIVALSAEKGDLYSLIQEARKENILHINFLMDMIELRSDSNLEKKIAETDDASLNYIGVGLFGDNDILRKLTKRFSLWK